MTFTYSTEYRLGPKRRITRTYGGVQAMIAIAFDLVLGLTFASFGLTLWMFRAFGAQACRVIVGFLAFPIKAARAVASRLPRRRIAKPAWASFDEL